MPRTPEGSTSKYTSRHINCARAINTCASCKLAASTPRNSAQVSHNDTSIGCEPMTAESIQVPLAEGDEAYRPFGAVRAAFGLPLPKKVNVIVCSLPIMTPRVLKIVVDFYI